MTISQISPNSITTNPAYTNPYAKTDQTTATPQLAQNAHKTVQTAKTDTVTLSQQALQKANGAQNMPGQTNQGQPAQTGQTTAQTVYQYPSVTPRG